MRLVPALYVMILWPGQLSATYTGDHLLKNEEKDQRDRTDVKEQEPDDSVILVEKT